MATTAGLMTVEQYRQLPEPKNGIRYELHHGELIQVTFPKHKHLFLQSRLEDLFKRCAEKSSFVAAEFAFRPYAEHELWAADVGYVPAERARKIDFNDNLHGSPNLVVEVLSPSNTASEINEKEAICLDTGCQEFWIVDPDRKIVKVSTPDRKTITYRLGDSIPLPLLGNQQITVDEIFEGLP